VCDERADGTLRPGMTAAVEGLALLGAHVGYREGLRYGDMD
jgi:hypothetical protein